MESPILYLRVQGNRHLGVSRPLISAVVFFYAKKGKFMRNIIAFILVLIFFHVQFKNILIPELKIKTLLHRSKKKLTKCTNLRCQKLKNTLSFKSLLCYCFHHMKKFQKICFLIVQIEKTTFLLSYA